MKKFLSVVALLIGIVQIVGLSSVEAYSEGSAREDYSYICVNCKRGYGVAIYVDGQKVKDTRDDYCPRGGYHSWVWVLKDVYCFRGGRWVLLYTVTQ